MGISSIPLHIMMDHMHQTVGSSCDPTWWVMMLWSDGPDASRSIQLRHSPVSSLGTISALKDPAIPFMQICFYKMINDVQKLATRNGKGSIAGGRVHLTRPKWAGWAQVDPAMVGSRSDLLLGKLGNDLIPLHSRLIQIIRWVWVL